MRGEPPEWRAAFAYAAGSERVQRNGAQRQAFTQPVSPGSMSLIPAHDVALALALTLVAAGCTQEGPDGPTLDGTSPDLNGTLQPDRTTAPAADGAPETQMDPDATLEPDAPLEPDTTAAP